MNRSYTHPALAGTNIRPTFGVLAVLGLFPDESCLLSQAEVEGAFRRKFRSVPVGALRRIVRRLRAAGVLVVDQDLRLARSFRARAVEPQEVAPPSRLLRACDASGWAFERRTTSPLPAAGTHNPLPRKSWTLFNTTGLVFVYLARHPDAPMREVAEAVGVSRRRVADVIQELEGAGLLTVRRGGRNNSYSPTLTGHIRHPAYAPLPLKCLAAAFSN